MAKTFSVDLVAQLIMLTDHNYSVTVEAKDSHGVKSSSSTTKIMVAVSVPQETAQLKCTPLSYWMMEEQDWKVRLDPKNNFVVPSHTDTTAISVTRGTISSQSGSVVSVTPPNTMSIPDATITFSAKPAVSINFTGHRVNSSNLKDYLVYGGGSYTTTLTPTKGLAPKAYHVAGVNVKRGGSMLTNAGITYTRASNRTSGTLTIPQAAIDATGAALTIEAYNAIPFSISPSGDFPVSGYALTFDSPYNQLNDKTEFTTGGPYEATISITSQYSGIYKLPSSIGIYDNMTALDSESQYYYSHGTGVLNIYNNTIAALTGGTIILSITAVPKTSLSAPRMLMAMNVDHESTLNVEPGDDDSDQFVISYLGTSGITGSITIDKTVIDKGDAPINVQIMSIDDSTWTQWLASAFKLSEFSASNNTVLYTPYTSFSPVFKVQKYNGLAYVDVTPSDTIAPGTYYWLVTGATETPLYKFVTA